ncbi:MAG: 50S ribosomal protein L23 [Eubacteriales bacterium]|nr:50S ribosomal protein L23 [Eubacteriales bacterium]
MKDAHDIIIRPVLTEESYEGFSSKRYVFEVAIGANKTEIKQAVEAVFKGVKVDKVNTVRTLGKIKRQGKTQGRTAEVKKAYVTLKEDSKAIEFFEGMAE